MWVVLNELQVVVGFDNRDLPLEDICHMDFFHLYVKTQYTDVKLGDIYDAKTGKFATPEVQKGDI